MKAYLFSALFLAIGLVLAAPAPWGIAINEETQECAGYWGGDEFVGYALPEGWANYYPDYSEGSSYISTAVGECNFTRYNEEDCCNELGLTYVSDNIGERNATAAGDESDWSNISVILFIALLILFPLFLVIMKLTRGSHLPFVKNYLTKCGIFGVWFGLMSSLAFYSIMSITPAMSLNLLTGLFVYPSLPVHLLIQSLTGHYGYGNLLTYLIILLLNLVYFSFIAIAIGYIIKKFRK